MNESNRNIEILNMLKKWIEEGQVSTVRQYVTSTEFSETERKALYARCINDLKKITDLSDEEFKNKSIKLCDDYLDLAKGYTFSKSQYNNEYRKRVYKQLNVDVPMETMQEFERVLIKNKTNKKTVIMEAIKKYIDENK